MPNASYKEGIKPSNNNSTIVTKLAITTINAGIRTLSGIILRNKEIITLLNANTTVVVSPIPKPFIAEVVTAKVGHIPSIRTKVGFSLNNPFTNLSFALFILATSQLSFIKFKSGIYTVYHSIGSYGCTTDGINLIR